MIEVRLFATFREGREKITFLPPKGISTARDIIQILNIDEAEVAILLINGKHRKPESPVQDGDILALFPPVGGG